jgi:chitinase
LGFYEYLFQLADFLCNTPGCDFYTKNNSTGGGAVTGEYTGTSGFLSDHEISRIISDYSVNVHYDEAAGVNWMTWSGDQWCVHSNTPLLFVS